MSRPTPSVIRSLPALLVLLGLAGTPLPAGAQEAAPDPLLGAPAAQGDPRGTVDSPEEVPDEAPESQQPEPDEPEGEKGEAPRPGPVELELVPGYGMLHVSGSRENFFQYHTPPSGFFIGLTRVMRRDPLGFALQEAWWRNLGEPDQKGYVDLHLRDTPSYFRYWRDQARFYGDPLFPGGPYSARIQDRLRLHLERNPRGPAARFFFNNQQLSIPAIGRYAPDRGIRYGSWDFGARVTIPVGAGQLSFTPRKEQLDLNTGRLPDSDTTWLTGELNHPLGSRADLTAFFERIATNVVGQETATWSLFRVQGTARPTDTMLVNAFFRSQVVDLPFTVTRYADRSSLAGVDVSARPARRLSLRAGLFHEDVRRTSAGAAVEENSAWNGGWAHLRYTRLGLGSLNVRYREKRLSNAPPSFLAAPPFSGTTLYYTRDRSLDARVDTFLGPVWSFYAAYNWRQRENDQRGTRFRLGSVTAGAAAALSPRLTFNAEYMLQDWSGNTRPFRGEDPLLPGVFPTRFFFSDGRIFTGGLSYVLDGHSSLELSYNAFSSTGGQSARDHLALLRYRREVSRDFYWSVGYQHERFEDASQGFEYRAFPLVLELGFRRTLR